MAYRAIYRKWRPLVFEDIVGQSHVTKTLKNQIMNNRVSHAYLFCGTRGTGKTTAAKVFSRAVNCLNNQNGSPCNECAVCKGILDGSIMDVSEIDAASNNRVENVREILEDVNYVASQTTYRIYIIDEVHMLSSGAFNALLKTLEEPPEHVIFILATTEAHKVPETILSRCQRFDFKRIRPSDIILRMKEIAVGDKLDVSDDAFALLAQLAEGSMRDGLSLLERCISACGTRLTRDDVVSVLGISGNETNYNIVDAVSKNDSARILKEISRLMEEGKDLNVFMDFLITYVRNLLVCKVAEKPEELIDASGEDIVKLKSQAERLSFEKINNAITVLSKAKADAHWEKSPRTIYELALVKLTRPELDTSTDALMDRISEMEEKVKNGITVNVSENVPKEEPKEEPKKKEVSKRLYVPLDVSKLTTATPVVAAARKWDKIASVIMKQCPFVAASVVNRKITIDGEGILLLYSAKEVMLKKIMSTYIKQAERVFQKNTGTELRLKAAFEDDVGDNLVDFWNVPEGEQKEDDTEGGFSDGNDPLMQLGNKFSEIVEYTDESEFVDYSYEDNSFSQEELDDEEEEEEFLDDSEKRAEQNLDENAPIVSDGEK